MVPELGDFGVKRKRWDCERERGQEEEEEEEEDTHVSLERK